MGKFNVKSQSAVNTPTTVNRAGGQAFKQSDKLELVSMLLTNMVQDQYYRKEDKTRQELTDLVARISDKKFAAKAGIYARTVYGMRSISHALAGEIVRNVKGQDWTRHFIDKIVYRADDMTEILAYYLSVYGKPIPNSLKKGLALAVQRFDDYALAKYRGEGNKVAMVDMINLIRVKPNLSINKLMKGELKPADTWETRLTQAGQKAETEDQKEELKAEAWKDLIGKKKLGYFALLRNLRNIIEQAPDMVSKACEMLVDEKAIKKSLVFPFRFLSAYQEINHREVLDALNKAIDISLNNVPKFEGNTVVVLDVSGSMTSGVTKYNKMTPAQIGSLFAAVLWKSNPKADFMLFSDDAHYVTDNKLVSYPTMELSKKIVRMMQPAGTNFNAIFQKANKPYDRFIILSDMQGWIGYTPPTRELNRYKSLHKANPKIYSFDLQGYGDMQFPEPNIYAMAGFSDKVFDLMKTLEVDREALIKEIEKILL